MGLPFGGPPEVDSVLYPGVCVSTGKRVEGKREREVGCDNPHRVSPHSLAARAEARRVPPVSKLLREIWGPNTKGNPLFLGFCGSVVK